MLNNLQNKLNEYIGVVRDNAFTVYSILSPLNIGNGLKSPIHFQYYIFNKEHLEQEVYNIDKERALKKLSIKPNDKNIRTARRFGNDVDITSKVREYLEQRHADLIAIYDNSLDVEHEAKYRANMYGTLGQNKISNLFNKHAESQRRTGDESIELRKKFEILLKTLNTKGLEGYVNELAKVYPIL